MRAYCFKSLKEAYSTLLNDILTDGIEDPIESEGKCNCIDLGPTAFEMEGHLKHDIFFSRSQMLYCLVDAIYVWSGRNDSEVMSYYKDFFKVCCGEYGFFENALGKRIYELHGNQIDFCYRSLKMYPYNAKSILFLMGSEWDLTDCTIYCQFMRRNDYLDITINYRASDFIQYMQNDIFLYSIILEIMAKWLGLKPGKIIYFANRLYITKSYESAAIKMQEHYQNLNVLKQYEERESYIDRGAIRTTFFRAIDLLIQWNRKKNIHIEHCKRELQEANQPDFVRVWLEILLAEIIRKNLSINEYKEFLDSLEDSIYKFYMEFFDSYQVDEKLEVI